MYFYKKSQCHDRLNRHMTKRFKNLEEHHLMKWAFLKSQGINDEYPGGRPIKFNGVRFEGSPCQIFWSPDYIPGFIEEIFDECLKICTESSKEFNIHPNKCSKELESLFSPKISETYRKMAEIDSRLRGDGVDIPHPIDTMGHSTNLQKKIKEKLDCYKLGVCKNLWWWLRWPIRFCAPN